MLRDAVARPGIRFGLEGRHPKGSKGLPSKVARGPRGLMAAVGAAGADCLGATKENGRDRRAEICLRSAPRWWRRWQPHCG
jgi:hypothetical protein